MSGNDSPASKGLGQALSPDEADDERKSNLRKRTTVHFEVDESPEEMRRIKNAAYPRTRSSIFSRANDRTLDWDRVVNEERDFIESSHRRRNGERARGSESFSRRFSVAFSGGGMRAAAFQAGVLWQLAESDRLRDVEYLAAVSGGGYIASAFLSHCLREPPPVEDEDVKAWYLRVVAKTICRFQRNGGNFVRDCAAQPGVPKDGSGCMPRFMDLPVLIVTLVSTLSVNPLWFIIAILVPVTVYVETFFGVGLRAGFCTSAREQGLRAGFPKFEEFSDFKQLQRALICCIGVTLVIFMVSGVLPCCKLRYRDAHQGKKASRPEAPIWYLVGHAANAFMVRATLSLAACAAFVIALLQMEQISYHPEAIEEMCHRYIAENTDMTTPATVPCGFSFPPDGPVLWWDTLNFTFVSDVERIKSNETIASELSSPFGFMGAVSFSLGLSLLFFCLCIPCFGLGLVVWFLATVVGPMFVLLVLLNFTQLVIFGPITQTSAGLLPAFSPDRWKTFVGWSFVSVMLLLPFYEDARALLHWYYRRCLQKNFFHSGRDAHFSDLADDYARPGELPEHDGVRYAPLLLLTVTSSDYQPPGDTDTISELFLSPLHVGGEETGYIRQNRYRSLSKGTALTGAGCLDAISLSMSDALTMRFWLEFLNLSWGDFILFERKSKILDFAEGVTGLDRLGFAEFFVRMIHRIPAGLVWEAFYGFLWLAWEYRANESCRGSADMLMIAGALWTFLMFSSIFSFLPCLDLFALSALSRQVLQATKFFYVGRTPPRMLYVTDGGVMDCTAVVQLMRRRCERILLILAAGDNVDHLNQLRTAMAVAQREEIGSFFDPEHPKRSVEVLLKQFSADKSMPHVHLGICYSWGEDGGHTVGDFYVVKHRLPPEFEGEHVSPLMTEAEIQGEPAPVRHEILGNLTTSGLGGLGCCDCCHSRCNAGPKFPHGAGTGYLYLSPTWVNSLARLGHRISASAVDAISAPRSSTAMAWAANRGLDHSRRSEDASD